MAFKINDCLAFQRLKIDIEFIFYGLLFFNIRLSYN